MPYYSIAVEYPAEAADKCGATEKLKQVGFVYKVYDPMTREFKDKDGPKAGLMALFLMNVMTLDMAREPLEAIFDIKLKPVGFRCTQIFE